MLSREREDFFFGQFENNFDSSIFRRRSLLKNEYKIET